MSVIEYFPNNCFKNIIQEQFKNDILVLSFETSYVLPPGQNFLCDVFRIIVKFSEKNCNKVHSQSFIAKLPLESQYAIELQEQIGFFDCEMDFYNNVVTFLENLEFTKKIYPKPHYLSKESKKMILLEDLSMLNYQMPNSQEGLNLKQCLFAIKKLAYFHAASLKIYEQEPSVIEKHCKGPMYKNVALERLISVTFSETLKICQKFPSLQKYFDKMPKDFPEKFYSSTKRDPNFNVLNHGDFWCNNIMFKYNKDEHLEDVLFVDFQMVVFTSPVFDLHYFLASSPNLEVLKNHINTIIDHYYHSLCKYALVLNTKMRIPQRYEFDLDFRHKAFAGFAILSTLTPLGKANKRKDASLTEFIENDEEGSFRHDCMNNPHYLNVIKCLLPYYETLGMFNF